MKKMLDMNTKKVLYLGMIKGDNMVSKKLKIARSQSEAIWRKIGSRKISENDYLKARKKKSKLQKEFEF